MESYFTVGSLGGPGAYPLVLLVSALGVLGAYAATPALGGHEAYSWTGTLDVRHLWSLGALRAYLLLAAGVGALGQFQTQSGLESFGGGTPAAESTIDETQASEIPETPQTATTVTSETDSQSAPPEPEGPTADQVATEDEERGVIYARVSSKQQVDEGNSIEDQIERLEGIAEDRGIEAVETVADRAESGRDFDRPGIRRVRKLALQDDVEYVLVDDVDRIGRHAAENIFYVYELRSECGVTLITTEQGEVDISTFRGMTMVMFRSLSSQMENDNRTRRAHNACVQKFKRKNWSTYHQEVPLGYTHTDNDWLEVDEEESDAVTNLFDVFLSVEVEGAYRETAKRAFGVSNDTSSSRLKRMLENSVYVGEPSVNTTPIGQEDDGEIETSVADASLQIVSDETFQQAQRKVRKITERYGGKSGDVNDVERVVDKFGLWPTIGSSPVVKIHCPECGGETVRNGTRFAAGRMVHNYRCSDDECGRQRVWPTESEWEELLDW